MFHAVDAVIAEEVGVSLESLKPETRLLHDFGIYGDDVDEILRRHGKLGQIDWFGLRFDDYLMIRIYVTLRRC